MVIRIARGVLADMDEANVEPGSTATGLEQLTPDTTVRGVLPDACVSRSAWKSR